MSQTIRRIGARLALLGVLSLSGCAAMDVSNALPFAPRPTTTKELQVAERPPVAYERAIAKAMGMGCTIAQLQPQAYRISAQCGPVALNVVITAAGSGSLLAASQHVSESVIAYAPVRVAERFLAAYGGTS